MVSIAQAAEIEISLELVPIGTNTQISEGQLRPLSKYIKLAKGRPELLSNDNLGYHLDVNSELKLLSLDDNTAE